jgi:pimeloyl-ACP methyl ester carboxylesterase
MPTGRIGGGCLGLALIFFCAQVHAATPGPGTHSAVKVSAPTRLDWTFVVTNRSLARVPENWLPDYDSIKQTYELYVPSRKSAKSLLPLVLFLSPGNDGGTGKSFARLAQARGWLYAAPANAGNDCPPRRRIRIILDVLDDLRRHFPVDPDRTYITGFSGGGRIAGAIAFALPELFGGIIPVCAGGFPRDESWLRQRVVERLSVALVTGATDFNRGEVERLRGPFLKDVGVRTRVWTVAGMGHAMPDEKNLTGPVNWLEEGLAKRRALAVKYPSARLLASDDVSRSALAKALIVEGRKRLKTKGTLYAGLMQIKGVMERWPDLEVGKEAQKLLEEYDEKPEKPWEADDLAEQRQYLAAQARALDRYACGPLDKQYVKMRDTWLRQAVQLWQKVLADSQEGSAGKEAKKRIGELEKLLEKE